MRIRSPRRSLPALIGSVLVVMSAAVALAMTAAIVDPGPAGAVIDDPDIDTSADYRYRVDPEAGQVEVTIELVVTADKANQSTPTGFYQYYFDGTFLAVPAEVGDLRVTDGTGRSLDYEIDDAVPEVIQLIIDFRTDLYYRQSAEVVVTFALLGGAPRGEELTRVNGAYAGFPAWVDPRLEEASLSVITPLGFVDRGTGSEQFEPPERRPGPDGDELWFVADDIDPEFQWASVSLARDEALVTTDFAVDVEIENVERQLAFDVLAWPGDQVWTDFVTDNLEDGLPVLADRIGLPWPVERDLTIIESYDPYLNGYAGWYDLLAEEIEIGDELDTHVMFHELSHVWFNGALFEERWITEGLADEFGAEVVEALGEDRPEPPSIGRNTPVSLPLNQWTSLTEEVEQEEWAYGASWTVTEALVDEVGLDVLAAAVRAAADDEIAYFGDGEPEPEFRANDWRLYLDLIENHGQVEDDGVVELFEQWVVGPGDLGDLDDRAAGRLRYLELARAGEAWAPPLVVRRAMSNWDFVEAGELMGDAQGVLDRRTQIVEVLDDLAPLLPAGSIATLPGDLEQTYEQAEEDLVEASDLVDRALAVAEDLRDAGQAVDEATGPLQRVGAIGTDHRDELAVAVARFVGGDLDRAAAAGAGIADDVDRLSNRGLLRIGAAAALLIAVAIASLWLRRRRAASRDTPIAELPSGLATDDAPGAAQDGASGARWGNGEDSSLRVP